MGYSQRSVTALTYKRRGLIWTAVCTVTLLPGLFQVPLLKKFYPWQHSYTSAQCIKQACLGVGYGRDTDRATSAGQKKVATLPACFEGEVMFSRQLYMVTGSMQDHLSEIVG